MHVNAIPNLKLYPQVSSQSQKVQSENKEWKCW